MITKLKHATRVTTLWLKQPICFYSVQGDAARHAQRQTGVRSEEVITNHLLSKQKLTFDKAMELAQAIESAECDTRQLQAAQSTSTTP